MFSSSHYFDTMCVCMKQTSFPIHYLHNDFSEWWRFVLSFIGVLNVVMQFRKSADCNAHKHNNMLEADVLCIKVECCYRYSVFPASSHNFLNLFWFLHVFFLHRHKMWWFQTNKTCPHYHNHVWIILWKLENGENWKCKYLEYFVLCQ